MKRGTRIALGAATAVVAAGVVAAWSWNEWTHRELAAAKARCRDAGLPTTVAEIRPPAIPPEHNAAPLIEQIGARMETEAFTGAAREKSIADRLGKFGERKSPFALAPAEADELAQILAEPVAAEIVSLARQAAAKRGYDAQLEYERAAAMLMTNLQPLRFSVQLLGWHARLAATRGDADTACADVWSMLALAEFPAAEPTLISFLTRCACLGIAVETLEKLTAANAIDATWSTRFGAWLDARDLERGFVRALDGERVAFGSITFEQMLGAKTMPAALAGRWWQSIPGLKWIPFGRLRLEYAFYLDQMRLLRLEAEKSSLRPPIRRDRLREITSAVPRHRMLTAIIVPTLEPLFWGATQWKMKTAVASAGLALDRYRRKHGHYPDALTDLTPEFLASVPADAFTAKPLLYRKNNDSALVYSVGRNFTDDGGVFDFDTKKDDVVWTAAPAPPLVP